MDERPRGAELQRGIVMSGVNPRRMAGSGSDNIPDPATNAGLQVINFGCRLNIYEGEVIRQQAQAAGLADAIVFNSCAVTAEAERQVRQAIRKARREHPQAKIIVTGCSAQAHPDMYKEMDEVH